jgi:hypothetical protein
MSIALLVLILNLKLLLAACFMLVSGLAYTSTLKMEAICSPETSVGFTGFHSVIHQKTKFFINADVSSSNSSQFSVS